MDDFEVELKPILEALRRAEKEQALPAKTGAFKSALSDLDDIASDYPEHAKNISKYKLPYVRQLLTNLSSTRPDISFDAYIDLIVVLLSNAKDETKKLISNDASLKKYLIELLSMWPSVSQLDLKSAFEEILQLTPEDLKSIQRPNTRIKDTVEILYLLLMYRWETTAPEDGKQGLLDEKPERNTQMPRLAYILGKITAGRHEQEIYTTLERNTRRKDGESYVSKDTSWMKQPFELTGGWFLEGCTKLEQKQEIVQTLTKAGLSPAFVAAVDDFVAGNSIKSYIPTEEEEREILAKVKEKELLDEDF